MSLPIDIKSSPDVVVPSKSGSRSELQSGTRADTDFESAIKSREAQEEIREKNSGSGKDSFHTHSTQTVKKDKTEENKEESTEEVSDVNQQLTTITDEDEASAAEEAQLMAYVSLQEMLISLEKEIAMETVKDDSLAVEDLSESQSALPVTAPVVLFDDSKERMVESDLKSMSDDVAIAHELSAENKSNQSDVSQESLDEEMDQADADTINAHSIKQERPTVLNAEAPKSQLATELEVKKPQNGERKIETLRPSSFLAHSSDFATQQQRDVTSLKETHQVDTPREVKTLLTIDETTLKAKIQENISVAVKEGRHQIQIRLDPPEMGRIFVKLDMGSKDIHIQMLAEHPQVKEVLDKSLLSLKHMLGEQGLNLGNVNVGVGGDQEWREKLARDENASGFDESAKVAVQTKKASFRARDLRASTIDHLV